MSSYDEWPTAEIDYGPENLEIEEDETSIYAGWETE